MTQRHSPPVILMADDDEDDCYLVGAAFKEMGLPYELRFVHDGRELLDYLSGEGAFGDPEQYPAPDLILLDLNMPRVDGREALAILKTDPRWRHIPIVILTTSREERDIELSRRAGASCFLSKPSLFEDLARMIDDACKTILEVSNAPFKVIGC